ncbi:MAG: hypothetical protein IH946_11165, partial [Bacteroidetes bacterium]|nr:hypothetical protein [Bacteroidota bacterium]
MNATMKVLCYISSAILCCLISHNLRSQVTYYTDTFNISQSPFDDTIHLAGTLDVENTYTHTYADEGPFQIAFQPMEWISFENKGTTKIQSPRIVFNNRGNWFNDSLLLAECLGNAQSEKEKLMALWMFCMINRVHRIDPEISYETRDIVKLLGVYGYGTCGYVSAAIQQLGEMEGTNTEYYNLLHNNHAVSEVKIGNEQRLSILDCDIDVFYPMLDNYQIAAHTNIVFDRHLIRRTHHYGIEKPSWIVQKDKWFGSLYTYSDIKYTQVFYSSGHTLDFMLKPGEKVTYNYSHASLYHHYSSKTANVGSNILRNGIILFNPDLVNIDMDQLIDGHQNLTSEYDDSLTPALHAIDTSSLAEFVIKVKSPFVILDADIDISYYSASLQDSVELYFSKDSSSWIKKWVSSSIGNQSDSIDVDAQIETLNSPATYEFYLRFILHPNDSIGSCGINNITISTTFQ